MHVNKISFFQLQQLPVYIINMHMNRMDMLFLLHNIGRLQINTV